MAAVVPFIVGLTGGIASGKTLVSDCFARLGITIIDADIIARDVVAPGTAGLQAIVDHFGNSILTPEGALNRSLLRAKVFSNNKEKQWLNNCLHPRIRAQMQQDIQTVTSPYGILSVPLLLENKLQSLVNRILVVDCRESTQLERALQRDGSDESIIKGIMASQASREDRVKAADDVINNDDNPNSTERQVEEFHRQYLAFAAQNEKQR